MMAGLEARKRSRTYKEELGSYFFYFRHNGKNLWFAQFDACILWLYIVVLIIATEDDGTFGRLINHSKLHPNVVVKVVASNTRPYLCIFAATNIGIGQELLYDYGERSKVATENFAWLKM
jgi:hypothetical protein